MTIKVTRPEFDAVEKLKELDSHKGVAGEALLRADTVREQQNLLGIRGKNILYNGAMNVSQRYTSFSGITSATDYYVCDRWSLQTSLSGSLTVSQDADGPPEFQNCYKINVDTADPSPTTGIFRQHLQGDELQFLKYGTPEARDMTLSFWVKSSATGMYGFDIEQYDGTNYQIFVANYDINQPDVWEYKTIKIPGNPHHAIANDSNARFNLHWWFAFNTSTYAGGNRKTNTWQPYSGPVINDTYAMQLMAKAGNYIKFTGVQLELGSVATPFEYRSYGEELALCQRYGVRLGAHPDDLSSDYNLIGSGWWRASTVLYNLQIQAKPPVTLRHKNYSAYVIGTNQFYVQSGGTVGQASFYALNNPGSSPDAIWLDFTATTAAATDGQAAAVASNNNPAYNNAIFIDAEL